MTCVLTYVALYPLRELQKWVRYFGNALFMAMISQTGMLFWSLSFRLRDYGITENRYFVLIFGFWLMAMAIYFLVSQTKDIRFQGVLERNDSLPQRPLCLQSKNHPEFVEGWIFGGR